MPEGGTRKSVQGIMEESMNLRPLIYDPKDNHRELASALSEFAALVVVEREKLTKTLNW
jgi:hypothetical protein